MSDHSTRLPAEDRLLHAEILAGELLALVRQVDHTDDEWPGVVDLVVGLVAGLSVPTQAAA